MRGVDAVLKTLPWYCTPDEFAGKVLVKLRGAESLRDLQGLGRRVWRSVLKHCEGFFELIEHILEEQELLNPSQRRRFYQIIVAQFSSGGLGVHDMRVGKKNDASRQGPLQR
jgi:hypothetical protein